MPDFIPNSIACGSFKDTADAHFYLCDFHSLSDELPDIRPFTARLAELHTKGASPNGKFGFQVVTYHGNLPQDNTYTDTWEEFFANGLKHMLKLNKSAAGPSELDALAPAMFEKVIPRLLRPLKTGGRSVKPSLVYGDLWCSNTAIDLETDNLLCSIHVAFGHIMSVG